MDFWQQCLLDEANYTVWIDEAGIRAGHKWRNEIADGIQVSIFFTFFTNHYNIMHSRSYLFTGLQCVSVHHDATLSKLCVLSRWGESSYTHTHTHTHTHFIMACPPSWPCHADCPGWGVPQTDYDGSSGGSQWDGSGTETYHSEETGTAIQNL